MASQTGTARTLGNWPMPARVQRLPRNQAGYPVPWFVATLDDGTRDFRIADQERHIDALRFKLCWVCGGRLGANVAFPIGPMCAVNRISAEPPSHLDCALYSAMVCPFLAIPEMRRREAHLPDDVIPAAGLTISRNPGVIVVWVTRTFQIFQPQQGASGYLCALGEPIDLRWCAQGRTATRAEVLAAMESGMPTLRDACQLDAAPPDSLKMLEAEYERALTLAPAV